MSQTVDRICVGAVLVRERDDRGPAPPLVLLVKRDENRASYPGVWDVLREPALVVKPSMPYEGTIREPGPSPEAGL